jgi:hypothetical protein
MGGGCTSSVCQAQTMGGAIAGRFNEAGTSAIFMSGFIGVGAATRIATLPKTGASPSRRLRRRPRVQVQRKRRHRRAGLLLGLVRRSRNRRNDRPTSLRPREA